MMEDPADITGIEMEMREQRLLGRVEVTRFDASEPPPYKPAPAVDISDYKMETIRDPGSAGPMIAFAVLVAVVMILMLVWS